MVAGSFSIALGANCLGVVPGLTSEDWLRCNDLGKLGRAVPPCSSRLLGRP